MCATIVVDNAAGRALRKKPAAVRVADVLYCIGEFAPGDVVYITFRGADGGQYVVAAGIAGCSEAELTRKIGPPCAAATRNSIGEGGDECVILAQDVKQLWPAS